jgi:hypothetical protein
MRPFTLFSGSPAPLRQLVAAVVVVDVAGREPPTPSPAAAQHGAPSLAVRSFSPAAQRALACWLAEHCPSTDPDLLLASWNWRLAECPLSGKYILVKVPEALVCEDQNRTFFPGQIC